MLAYATDRSLTGKRQSSPQAMLLIVSAHVALLAAAMSARMEMPPSIDRKPISVDLIKDPPPPPPNEPLRKQPQPEPLNQWIDHPKTSVPIPLPDPAQVDTSGTTVNTLPALDAGPAVFPEPPKTVVTPAIRHDPRLR